MSSSTSINSPPQAPAFPVQQPTQEPTVVSSRGRHADPSEQPTRVAPVPSTVCDDSPVNACVSTLLAALQGGHRGDGTPLGSLSAALSQAIDHSVQQSVEKMRASERPEVEVLRMLTGRVEEAHSNLGDAERKSTQRMESLARAVEALAAEVDAVKKQNTKPGVEEETPKFQREVFGHIKHTAETMESALRSVEQDSVRREVALRDELLGEIRRARRSVPIGNQGGGKDGAEMRAQIHQALSDAETERTRVDRLEREIGSMRKDVLSIGERQEDYEKEAEQRADNLERLMNDGQNHIEKNFRRQLDNLRGELMSIVTESDSAARRREEAIKQQLASLRQDMQGTVVQKGKDSNHGDFPGFAELKEDILGVKRSVSQCARGSDLDALVDEVNLLKEKMKKVGTAALDRLAAQIKAQIESVREDQEQLWDKLKEAKAEHHTLACDVREQTDKLQATATALADAEKASKEGLRKVQAQISDSENKVISKMETKTRALADQIDGVRVESTKNALEQRSRYAKMEEELIRVREAFDDAEDMNTKRTVQIERKINNSETEFAELRGYAELSAATTDDKFNALEDRFRKMDSELQTDILKRVRQLELQIQT